MYYLVDEIFEGFNCTKLPNKKKELLEWRNNFDLIHHQQCNRQTNVKNNFFFTFITTN